LIKNNKITLNKVIFVFFIIVIFVTFVFIYIQYESSKEILLKSYINKFAFQSLQIKEKFKNVFDRALYTFKTHEETDVGKLYLLPFFYENGSINLDNVARVLNSGLKKGHYEIFVINRNYKVIMSTYKPDIGYDLGKLPAFRKVLNDVFDGKEEINISNIFLDIASMNLKKYYLIRSPDKKYLLQLAYVVDIYKDLKKIYDFVRPSVKGMDIYFVNKYLIYKINMKKRYQKKLPLLVLYKNSYKILNEIIKCDESGENKKPRLQPGDKNAFLFKKVVDLFKKNNNIIKKFNYDKNELVMYTLINSVFDQTDNRVIIKTVYDIGSMKKDLDKLLNNLFLTFAFLMLIFVILYILIIHRASQTIIKLVSYMKKNEPCEDCGSFIKEIDELKESYNTLHCKLNMEIEKNKNLLDLNRRFIVDTIHQIRTPLNVIMLNTDLLKLEIQNKNVHDIIEEIDAAVAMLNNSYEDLAYLSSANTAITYKPSNIDISTVLKERVHFFNTIAKVNDKKLLTDIDDGVKYYINRIEFERIADNNISNAIKYSTEEEIFIELKKYKDRIILRFKSYGEPIKDPEKIFEKNYREQTHKRGLGLGLNIVKNICDKYSIKYRVYYENEMNVFEYRFKV
jgi:signal transduction histidine kinase